MKNASGGLKVVLFVAALCASLICFAAEEMDQVSLFRQQAGQRDPDAAATLVVYNSRDPVSLDLATYYARKRGIAADQIVGLNCATTEEITRDEYDANIAGPLRKIFDKHGWWTWRKANMETLVERNSIRFIALMRGIPLKISGVVSPYIGDMHGGQPDLDPKNEACVDSELATLAFFTRNISGALANPYYRSYKPIADAGMPILMLVCRLDAPTPEIVRRMIDDSIEAERNGLWGFAFVDARGISGGGMGEGDQWLRKIADDTQRHGIPVIFDNSPELFPAVYPMRNVALYYGWYTGDVAGPFAREDFRFNQGAIACHIHSFSANTLRSPHAAWVGPLLAAGAAATTGNVYEPFLALTPHLDILDERLRNGFTFAESCYMSQRVVSWMTTFVGDPLYRPFKILQDPAATVSRAVREWEAYRSGALTWFNKSRAAGEEKLQRSGGELRSGVIFEGLGLLQASAGDLTAACTSFEQAQKLYSNTEDILRSAIHEVGFLKLGGKNAEALALIRRRTSAYPSSPYITILRAFETDIAGTPPPVKKAPDVAR